MSTETELKLSLRAQDVTALLNHPLLAGKSQRQKLKNTYFDTPDLRLHQRKIAVRERYILKKTLLTIKTAGASQGGLASRSEWEALTEPRDFNFKAVIDDTQLADDLSLLKPELKPIFTTDFHRQQWIVNFQGACIEVALDRGKISSKTSRASKASPILELELELLEGTPLALFALARTLSKSVYLKPNNISKAQRGYALFLDTQPIPTLSATMRLDSKLSPLETFQQISLSALSHLQANDPGMLSLTPEEYIHQARIAIRQIRLAIKLFSKILPKKFVKKWQEKWRGVFHDLENTRNWDVFLKVLMPMLEGPFPDHDSLIELRNSAQEQSHKARRKAQKVLESKSYASRQLQFAQAILSLDSLKEFPKSKSHDQETMSVKNFAIQILEKQSQSLKNELTGRHLKKPQILHQIRLDIKQSHDSMMFFIDFLPQKKTTRYISILSNLQKLLGSLNDLSTAKILIDQLKIASPKIALSWIAGQRSGYLKALPVNLKALKACDLPWHK